MALPFPGREQTDWYPIVVLQIAMPAQTVMSIITNEAGSDVAYSAEYIFLSTILSIGTLPLVYYLAERII